MNNNQTVFILFQVVDPLYIIGVYVDKPSAEGAKQRVEKFLRGPFEIKEYCVLTA